MKTLKTVRLKNDSIKKATKFYFFIQPTSGLSVGHSVAVAVNPGKQPT